MGGILRVVSFVVLIYLSDRIRTSTYIVINLILFYFFLQEVLMKREMV